MKKMFLIAALVVAAACGKKDPVQPQILTEPLVPTFTRAAMLYWGDTFELSLMSDNESMKFYLAADRVEDAFQAALTAGTYEFSRDGGRFALLPSSYYIGGALSVNIAGGKISIESRDGQFTVRFDVTLSDDRRMRGGYRGEITNRVTESDLADDLSLDFPSMTNQAGGPAYAQAEEDFSIPGLWLITLWGENPDTGEEWTALLHINAAGGMGPGRYALVPTFMTGGTLNVWPSGSRITERGAGREIYVAPGSGSLTLARDGEKWDISFAFETYEGFTVTGTYAGALSII